MNRFEAVYWPTMRDAYVFHSATLLFLVLLVLPSNLAWTSARALPEQSWTRSLAVAAGDRQFVTGGIDFARNIEVQGTVKIQSCCGYSTNDIDFLIRGVDYPGNSFGVVVDTFAFEWNSGQNDRYDFIFDNQWLVCGGTPFTCARNETSPSYHDKTVELTVREVAPLGPYLSVILPLLLPVFAVVSIAVIGLVVILLKKRRPEKGKEETLE